MKNIITAVKGTRDFYPQKMAQRNWLLERVRYASESFGYQEWDAPFLEKIDLYAAKSGEELVREQAFVFNDRGGDPVTLRPELTPSLARLVAQQQNELTFPLRWWSFGPFWRYERPQKGRTREFFQWNIDLIGVNSPQVDAELLAVAAQFLRSCGLKPSQVKLLVNDREMVNEKLAAFNLDGERIKSVLQLIDRRDKLPEKAWIELALGQGYTEDQIRALDLLVTDQNGWKDSPTIKAVFEILSSMGVSEYVAYSPSVIRGLDYYTGIVFEAKDMDGGRSILGGGRYENLVEDVGGETVSACGFAMGDVMIGVILEKYGLMPEKPPPPADVLVAIFDEQGWAKSINICNYLRSAGLRTILYPENAKLNKQIKFADRYSIPWLVLCGPEEASRGTVTLRNLAKRRQEELTLSQVLEVIKQGCQ